MPLHYAEATPELLDAAWARDAVAIWPLGALEWHGSHLPLGLDGIVAEAFAARLAEAVEGVLLPGCWLPMTTLPHPHSLQVRAEVFRGLVDDTLAGLANAGARRVAIVTGHYAQGQEVELYRAATRAMDRWPGVLVFAATPLEPLDDPDLLDHAAHWEAAQLLSLRPDLVAISQLPGEVSARDHAILGRHPGDATAEEGAAVLDRGFAAWQAWLKADAAAVRARYAEREAAYADYIAQWHRTSWEQAIADWWTSRT